MRERVFNAVFAVVVLVPLAFHLLFRTCGRWAHGCRRSFLAAFLVEQGGVWADLVRSTELLFTVVVVVLLALALLDDLRERLPF